MRRMLIIWKIVLVILVVLACVITWLGKASEADAELERFYNEKYGKKGGKKCQKEDQAL